ncbi:carboxylesterase/lipase family protein [Burkholderia gladioli]|jgi:para-nitrobenzyl esterase|uniref:carboxylesterase/lipase family protein n=1 Tax=Burkholderia gladioli TaxID=28095 RepID=UPI00163DFFDE|nr:carboxylesterase family protein [Burkholderia gladioli]
MKTNHDRSRRRGRPLRVLAALALASALGACGAGGTDSPAGTSAVAIQTKQGAVDGVTRDGVTSWLGIPYAQPPVGPLRWRPPQALAPRGGELEAKAYGKACPQPTANNDIAADQMAEDCLYLNVQAPAAAKPASRLPVLVYIHGGAFTIGSGAQVDGSTIAAQQNLVFVSFNYRLGALGYLADTTLQASTGDPNLGNFAVLDQQAALRWVRENIAAFGGDPANVTVWGLSAGATSTFTLLAAPQSKGLFDKAVLESGGGGPYSNLAPATATAQADILVSAVGCSGAADVVACLRGKSPDQLVAAQANGKWRPTVDGVVLDQVPSLAFAAGNFNRVPVMIGGVYDEGTLFVPPALTADTYLPALASLAPPGYDMSAIDAAYPLANYAVPAQGFARAMGDALYACGNSARRTELSAWVPVFGWEFTDPSLSFPTNPTAFYLGTQHGLDSAYWFGPSDFGMASGNPAMQALGRTMKTYLGNFARSGDPNGDPAAARDPSLPNWPRFAGAAERATLELTTPAITASNSVFEHTHHCDTLWGPGVFPPLY